MKWKRIAYWVVTGPLIAMMLFAAFNYIFYHELIVDVFRKLGFPTYIIYPLAIAKLLGLVAIVTNKSRVLKEWAYAGFFFQFPACSVGGYQRGRRTISTAVICLILLIASYVLDKISGVSEV